MRAIRTTSLLSALCAAFLLAGCAGFGDVFGGNDRDPYDNRDDQTNADVRGTVERVDTSARRIVVDRDDSYRSDLRNSGGYGTGDGDEVAVYYDDTTRVEYQGQSFRPQDLEAGDRIQADVDEVGGRLVAEDIDVLYDVTSGGGGYQDDDYRDDDLSSEDLRGTVRYVDTRDRMLEIEASRYGSNFNTGSTAGSSNLIRVYYDASTVIEYQGRRYGPENLERGDVVELELRETGGRLLAEEIQVVGESALTGR